jgi:hypothetical protein
MFRIMQDPSSGSGKLYLTWITYNGSIVLVTCVVSVWRPPNTDNAHNNKYNLCCRRYGLEINSMLIAHKRGEENQQIKQCTCDIELWGFRPTVLCNRKAFSLWSQCACGTPKNVTTEHSCVLASEFTARASCETRYQMKTWQIVCGMGILLKR